MQNQDGPNRRSKQAPQGEQRPRQQQRQPQPSQRNAQRPQQRRSSQRQRPPRQDSKTGRQRQHPPDKRRPQKQKPPVKNHWFSATVMVVATVVGCIFLALFILNSASDLLGLNQPNNEYVVQIPENATIKQVSEILGKTGVVNSPLTFRAYMGLSEEEPVFNPGEYVFNSNMAYAEIAVALKTVRVEEKTVTITFVEHLTLQEIAELLEEEHVIKDSQDFIDYLDQTVYDYDFLEAVPESNLRYHRYEGYFFPDTYEFYIDDHYDRIAEKFLSNFGRKITDSMYSQMKHWDMTLDETITLASVIQKEAGTMREMMRVSSVFHNRRNNSDRFPRLESDVTLLYAEKFIKPYLTLANQDMLDAYNTYVREDIPVGPICNPGADAIYAALNPIDTNYFYFVTDVNEDFYYSATFEEHQMKIEEAKQADETGSGVVHGIGTMEPES